MKSLPFLYFIFSLIPVHASEHECLRNAALRWNIPEIVISGIIAKESNWSVKAINTNSNGTKDYGLMQINTVNVKKLIDAGLISNTDALLDPCVNIFAGSFLLRQQFNSYGYNWKAVGAYHSKTPRHRDKYAQLVKDIITFQPQKLTPPRHVHLSTQ